MNAHLLKLGGAILVLAVFILIVRAQRETIAGLDAEHKQLRQLAVERAELDQTLARQLQRQPSAADLQTMRETAEQIRALRASLVALETALAPAATPPKPAVATLPPPYNPPRTWTNAGGQTPAAAIETAIWSALTGDTKALAAIVTLSPEDEKKVESLFAGAGAKVQAEHGTPAGLFATLLATQIPGSLTDFDLLRSEQTADGLTVRVGLKQSPSSRAAPREISLHLRSGPTGWRIVVPGRVVNDALQMVTGRP